MRVVHQVANGQKLGHIIARFVGHAQVFVSGLEALCTGAVDGAADIALTPVVGGQRKRPVAEEAVQVFEIIQRGIGGGSYIMAAIVKRGFFEAVVAAGGGHKLPQPRSAHMRARFGYISAFDKGQEGDFRRHIALFHFIGNMKHIRFAAVDGAVEISVAFYEVAFVAAHQFGVDFNHAEVAAQIVPKAAGGKIGGGLIKQRCVQAHHGHACLIGRGGVAGGGGEGGKAGHSQYNSF